MYENVIRQINMIVKKLRDGEEIDISTIPLPEIMEITAAARGNIEGAQGDLNSTIPALLDMVSETGDLNGLCAVLEAIAVFLNDVDHILARNDLILHYRDVLSHRMPEYHYMKNNERIREYYRTHEKKDRRPYEGKGVVYTVVTGDYDHLDKPLVKDSEWDYIVFTDNASLAADGWEVRQIDDVDGRGTARLSRRPKILCHEYLKEYDYSIYLDGNLQITGDLREYIRKYSTGESMLCINHYNNKDAYEEAGLCKENGRDREDLIDAQMARYRAEGFPEDYGLTSNNFLIRDHRDEKLRKVMNDWWKELCDGSMRDQLSFTYCCWKNDFIYDSVPLFVGDNKYVLLKKHQNSMK